MVNTVVVEYEDYDDRFEIKETYLRNENEINKTVRKIFDALVNEVGEQQAIAAFKEAMNLEK